MITKKEAVTGKVAVWAIPTSSWERKAEDSPVFRYEIKTNEAYQPGAVKVQEYEISLVVPAGLDLLARAVATLQEQQKRVLADAQKAATELQDQINQLLLIGHEPTRVVDGEFLGAEPVEAPCGGAQGSPVMPWDEDDSPL